MSRLSFSVITLASCLLVSVSWHNKFPGEVQCCWVPGNGPVEPCFSIDLVAVHQQKIIAAAVWGTLLPSFGCPHIPPGELLGAGKNFFLADCGYYTKVPVEVFKAAGQDAPVLLQKEVNVSTVAASLVATGASGPAGMERFSGTSCSCRSVFKFQV